jgi:hypothetical protein
MMKSHRFATVLIIGLTGWLIVSASGLLSVSLSAQQPAARTGLLSERGLTAANFPQNRKLADDVYVWTDVHPSGLYTTNDLIVITTNAVLVANGQKDPPTTKNARLHQGPHPRRASPPSPSFVKVVEYTVNEITRLHKAGVPVDAALKQANWGPYSSWPLFDRNAQTAVQRVYEIGGQTPFYENGT